MAIGQGEREQLARDQWGTHGMGEAVCRQQVLEGVRQAQVEGSGASERLQPAEWSSLQCGVVGGCAWAPRLPRWRHCFTLPSQCRPVVASLGGSTKVMVCLWQGAQNSWCSV